MLESYSRYDRPAPARNLYFKGARLLDPRNGVDQALDLAVRDGNLEVAPSGIPSGADVVNLQGHIITPGWFDLHVHLREPGREVAETIRSGCHAAMNGGFTEVACMPNTDPPLDDAGRISWVMAQADGLPVNVHVISAATRQRKGQELVDMAEIVDTGVRAFSDDGSPIRNSALLRRAMEYSNMLGARIFQHAEDCDLILGGSMNEGEWSTRLGLGGMPSISESIDVMRCIMIARYAETPVHICHVSTKESVDWIRWGKSQNLKVTAEVCPHHLLLKDEACKDFETNFKMNPPLRTEDDRQALLAAFGDGTLDVYCTDHAPHTWETKMVEFDIAPFGIVGLETAMGLALTHFVPGVLSLSSLLERVVYSPREILCQPIPRIATGERANLTIIDPAATYKVDSSTFRSLSRNTPFEGWELKGLARGVVNRGYAFIKEPGME